MVSDEKVESSMRIVDNNSYGLGPANNSSQTIDRRSQVVGHRMDRQAIVAGATKDQHRENDV
jgi:hypothetical protein